MGRGRNITFMRLLAAVLLLTSAACAHAPSPTNHWTLKTSDGLAFTFQSCGLVGSGNEITEFISGGSGVVQKLPGKLRVFDAVCRRGVTSDRGLWTWRAAVGAAAGRKDATLQLHDAAGTVIAKWNLADVWPAQLEVSDATETVTFAIDALERVP
jgi:phage tail-like protein